MEHAVEKALNEITLVVFTTLGPAGAYAFMLTSLLAIFGNFSDEHRKKLGTYLITPVLIAMIGLIASATHLGTPSNALYVLTGIGRSPLSNEVGASILFLALSASVWFSYFSTGVRKLFRMTLTLLAVVAAVFFIYFTTVAYSVHTIITWYSIFVPFNQWMLAVVLGTFLAFLTLYWSEAENQNRFKICISVLFSIALVLSIFSFTMQYQELSGMHNIWTSAFELMPYYGLAIIFYVLTQLIAIVLVVPLEAVRKRVPTLHVTACIISAVGVFVMRFSFYMTYMTVGF